MYREALARHQEIGLWARAAAALEGLAGLACKLGRPASAAQLCAAAERLRGSIGEAVTLPERAFRKDVLATARRMLGEARFAAAWTAGLDEATEQVIAEALAALADAAAGFGTHDEAERGRASTNAVPPEA
jgi:hypothetical protein